MGLLQELKRRNVFKAGALYLVSSWVLLQVASLLLEALALPPDWLRLILALLMLGFPLVLIFSWVYEITPEGIKREKDVIREASITAITGRRINRMILSLLAAAVVLQLIDLANKTILPAQSPAVTSAAEKSEDDAISSPSAASAHSNTVPSIAVLPFADLSAKKDQQYFADGVAEEILYALSRISRLEVRGRTSSFYFRDRNEDLKSIAAQLNVDHILEGSVRKSGDKVRITVQLVNVPSDVHIWSKAYDRVLDDIFAIQEDIAASVASSMEVSLGIGELGSDPAMTRDVRAYDLFLEARRQWVYADPDHMLHAIDLLEQAVAIDPQFARGWALLANWYSVTSQFFVPDRAALYENQAKAAIGKAEQLAPDSWVLQLFDAQQLEAQHRWQEASGIYQQLKETGKGSYEVSTVTGLFEASIGHTRAALAHFEEAAKREPLNQMPVALAAAMYIMTGDFETARASLEKAEQLPVGNLSVVFYAKVTLALVGRDQAAIERALQPLMRHSDNSVVGKLGGEFISAIAPVLDSPEAALEILRRFAEKPEFQEGGGRSRILTLWAAYLGDPQLALDLQYTAGTPSVTTPLVLWHPILADMRRLPGFKQLVTDLGLVDYWRTTGKWGDFCKPAGDNDFECH